MTVNGTQINRFPDPLQIGFTGPLTIAPLMVTLKVQDGDLTLIQAPLVEQITTAVSAQIAAQYQEILTKMATFEQDVKTLTADVDTNTAAIKTLTDLDTADATLIADLKTQVATLKAATPTVDTTALEAAIAKLEANNAAAVAAAPAPVAPVAPAPPPPPPAAPPLAA